MTMRLAAALAAILTLAASPAFAHHRYHHHARHRQHVTAKLVEQPIIAESLGDRIAYAFDAVKTAVVQPPEPVKTAEIEHRISSAKPREWCGWEMRRLVSHDPGPEYNLARNWAHWGRQGPPGIGAVVVWPHHVGKITDGEPGRWIVKSGNDGHAVRERVRSIDDAIAIRWENTDALFNWELAGK